MIKGESKDKLIAGVDVSYFKEQTSVSCAVLILYPSFELINQASYKSFPPFPYIPGFLALREGELCCEAVVRLERKPGLLFVDGAGIAHPLGFGLATYLERKLSIPTIGITKRPFVGVFQRPGRPRNSFTYILQEGKRVGAAVRTQTDVKEIFVSPGGVLSIEESVKWTILLSRYRIPEPIRLAHQLSQHSLLV